MVGVCVVGIMAVGTWIGVRPGGQTQQIADHPGPINQPVVPPAVGPSHVTRIAGAPTLDVERVKGASGVERVGDSVLLAELREMGRPTGLVRTGGAVFLTANVAKEIKREEPRYDEPGA